MNLEKNNSGVYMHNALYTKSSLSKQPVRFRIEAVISDGMWYSLSKWQEVSNVEEDELLDYVEEALEKGVIVQSPTGSRSYRMPAESIINWYNDNNIDLYGEQQLLDFSFPPKIWAGMTEPEGFLKAPVREIGIVSFLVDKKSAEGVKKALKGIAKVRESEPGKYRAYGLNANYIKERVVEAIELNCGLKSENTKVYSRQISKRREMIDFDPKFAANLVNFYKELGKNFVKTSEKTISIYIPSLEEQDAQVLMWVLEAIEKFDESASVPFPGYLDNVLKRWPYNLPSYFLGKELSQFQKDRAKAIEELKTEFGEEQVFTYEDIADKMHMGHDYFFDLEEKHKAWIGTKNAEPLFWEDKGEEKTDESTESVMSLGVREDSNKELSNTISVSAIKSAIETGRFDDCIILTNQVDSGEVSTNLNSMLGSDFIEKFAQGINKSKVG